MDYQDYQTLPEKIDEILSYTSLSESEKAVLRYAYLYPGASGLLLKETVAVSDETVKSMLRKGLLIREKKGADTYLYPIPIILLLRRCGESECHRCLRDIPVLRSLDQWLKYPLMRSPSVTLKSSNNRNTVISWLFDLHASCWERVYCFGDYDSFIKTIGVDTEQEWIKERINKERKASVIATKDGKWAQHIQKVSQQELRDCLIDPRDFSDLFIMAFPDIHTTVMGSSANEITFVHSDTIANLYTGMVEKSLMKV